MRNQVFNTFWHGPALSPLHWACLKSFADRGHRLRVFSYEPLALPAGVAREDARQVIGESELFEFEDSFSAFSNIFRYKFQLEHGGWWVDTDVYCMQEDIEDCTYAWARQDDQNINGAILKFPAGDATLREILREAEQVGRSIERWGQIGPHLLTTHLAGREFADHYGTTEAFYPIHWVETHLFWLPGGNRAIQERCAQSPFIHLWGSMFKRYGIDISRQAPEGSFLRWMHERADFPFALPPMDGAELRRTCESVDAYLQKKWVRQKWEQLFGCEPALTAPQ
jgi:hypothetical protein